MGPGADPAVVKASTEVTNLATVGPADGPALLKASPEVTNLATVGPADSPAVLLASLAAPSPAPEGDGDVPGATIPKTVGLPAALLGWEADTTPKIVVGPTLELAALWTSPVPTIEVEAGDEPVP